MLGAPVTITPPTGELISLDSAKSFLRIDGDALDAEVEVTRDAAIERIEGLTGLRLLTQTVEVSALRFEELEQLRVGPVRSVLGIRYVDAAGAEQTLDGTAAVLSGAVLEQGIRPAATAFPAARWGTIVATLEVGYGDDAAAVPAKLRLAAFAALREAFDGEPVDLDPLLTDHRFWL